MLAHVIFFFIITIGIIFSFPQQEITSSGSEEDLFGTSVSVSGEFAIVGASFENTNGLFKSGAAYIFERDFKGNWIELQKLIPSDASQEAEFGNAVSISGDYAIIGAKFDDDGNRINFFRRGSAYIFKKNQQTGLWEQNFKLIGKNSKRNDGFGNSVSISGNYVIVGSSKYTNDEIDEKGCVFIFEKEENDIWIEKAQLFDDDIELKEHFGTSVSISGDFAAVGGYYHILDKPGRVIVFKKENDQWIKKQVLKLNSGESKDDFGHSVAISNDFIIVGASGDYSQVGAAYIFKRNNVTGIWNEFQQLRASDYNTRDRFGNAVDIYGNYAIVGSYEKKQAIYIYKFESGNWIEQEKEVANNNALLFGYSVGISENYFIVGTYTHSFSVGSSYIFLLNDNYGTFDLILRTTFAIFGSLITLLITILFFIISIILIVFFSKKKKEKTRNHQ